LIEAASLEALGQVKFVIKLDLYSEMLLGEHFILASKAK
jgi:hypothetical protein